ncbi:MAG: hypothetical protein A2X93_07710 [Deltaproteobacteria bacterium GWC2_56_8]|nr:MAG: hypothetical protein A2X93_07710 [Deltaproteobacteria bacterium GWC2_56_8]
MGHDVVEVDERPPALGDALSAERAFPVFPEPVFNRVGYGLNLPFRPGAADEQVIGYRRELFDVKDYDLFRLLLKG